MSEKYPKELIAKLAKKMTAPEMAKELKINEDYIYVLLKRHEVKPKKVASRRIELGKEELKTLYRTMTLEQMSKHLGCAISVISRRMREHGIYKEPKQVLMKNKHSSPSFSKNAEAVYGNERVTVYEPKNDPRSVFSRPIYNPSEREISWSYARSNVGSQT